MKTRPAHAPARSWCRLSRAKALKIAGLYVAANAAVAGVLLALLIVAKS